MLNFFLVRKIFFFCSTDPNKKKKIVEIFSIVQKTRFLVFLADDASVAVRTLHRTLVDGNEVSENEKTRIAHWVILVTKASNLYC